jgi:hypothetical protein
MGAESDIVNNRAKPGRSVFASPTFAALLIVAVAVATRIVAWWNPVAHVDDQFYLLAGQELLKGHWPYVDVWDRKPLGLFLLYAGIAWIGGGSILGLNLVATTFAAATAWVVRQIGLRFASATGATLGALAYLLVIPLVGGQTGQSPVFYNLLIAGAALLLIDAAGSSSASAVSRRALWAMLLCGLAMTIKQISFIEGAYIGLAFLWLMHRQGAGLARIAAIGGGMILVALLPTALTLLGYALAGREQLDMFIFSTVTSIFLKQGWSATAKLAGIAYFFLYMTPLLIMAAVGALDRHRARVNRPLALLLIGWVAASLAGYVAVPYFFDHYALPVVAPLSVSVATFFDRPSGKAFFLGLVAYCLIAPQIRDVRTNREARLEYEGLNLAVDRARQGGCIYVGDGPTRLYSTTGACQVTHYLFPDHLNLVIEAGAVGADTDRELQNILQRRPAVIVTQNHVMFRYSPAYRVFLARVRLDYTRIYVTSFDAPHFVQAVVVWQRKDLAPSHS